jgi:oligopeptide/dipeptide ABC transporter ATP-binding protein
MAELLRIESLATYFDTRNGTLKAVDGINLAVREGQTLGIVGESGSGKSVTGFSIMRLVEKPGRILPQSRIWFRGRDIANIDESELLALRGGEISMIFQEPMTSLNPVYTIGQQIIEAVRLHRNVSVATARDHAVAMLALVGIAAPERRIHDYPHQLSGGMRQRAMIAIALSCEPKLLIADEPTTALDVTIQAQILDLLKDLRERRGMAVILITHDLGVVAEMCDEIAVMYAGKIVERGPVEQVLSRPQHPYSEALLQSIPLLGMTQAVPLKTVRGVVPSPFNWPKGCRFAPRCDHAFERCLNESPDLMDVGPGSSACWLRGDGGAPISATVATREVRNA